MTNIQEDKFSMYYSLKGICAKNQTTVNSNPVFLASYNLLLGFITSIEQNRDAQLVENSGAATDKGAKKVLMCEKTLFIAKRIMSYASATNNSELLASVKITKSKLDKERDSTVAGICNNIAIKANENVANLGAYSVTAPLITDLLNAITAYNIAIPKPRNAVSQTEHATENLVKLFKDADNLISTRLDLDIEVFKATKPDFYSQYKTSRKIIWTHHAGNSIIGNVTEKSSGEPMKQVSFSFTPSNKSIDQLTLTEKVNKKSAIKGGFRVKHLAEGSYNVLITKTGYKPQNLMVKVVPTESTLIEVEMEKE